MTATLNVHHLKQKKILQNEKHNTITSKKRFKHSCLNLPYTICISTDHVNINIFEGSIQQPTFSIINFFFSDFKFKYVLPVLNIHNNANKTIQTHKKHAGGLGCINYSRKGLLIDKKTTETL